MNTLELKVPPLEAEIQAICAVERSRLHAPDFQLITPIGAALSKEQYLGAIATGHLKYLTWEPGPMEVRLQGPVAVIRYQAQLEVIFGGLWQVVWSQATEVRPAPQ